MKMMLWLELKLVLALVLQLTTHQMECGMHMKKGNQFLLLCHSDFQNLNQSLIQIMMKIYSITLRIDQT